MSSTRSRRCLASARTAFGTAISSRMASSAASAGLVEAGRRVANVAISDSLQRDACASSCRGPEHELERYSRRRDVQMRRRLVQVSRSWTRIDELRVRVNVGQRVLVVRPRTFAKVLPAQAATTSPTAPPPRSPRPGKIPKTSQSQRPGRQHRGGPRQAVTSRIPALSARPSSSRRARGCHSRGCRLVLWGAGHPRSEGVDDESACGRSDGSDWKAAGAASGCRGS